MTSNWFRSTLAVALILPLAVPASAQLKFDRSVLPIQAPSQQPITEMDARDATNPVPFHVDAPEGAPNVVIVLIDSLGTGRSAEHSRLT